MCSMLVIATILSLRSYRYQTSYISTPLSSIFLPTCKSLGLCPLSYGDVPPFCSWCPVTSQCALGSFYCHHRPSISTVVRSIVLSTFLSHPLPTSWCPVARLPAQFGAMSQPSRPATPGPSVTGIVVTLAVLRQYYVIL